MRAFRIYDDPVIEGATTKVKDEVGAIPPEAHWTVPAGRAYTDKVARARSLLGGLCVIAIGLTIFLGPFGDRFPFFVGYAICLVLYVKTHIPKRKATREDLIYLEQSSEPLWMVELSVSLDNEVVNLDRGILGFQNRSLFFSGRSYSFAIGPQDVKQGSRVIIDAGAFLDFKIQTFALRLRHPKELRISFTELSASANLPISGFADLKTELESFVESDPTEEQRSYPPLSRTRGIAAA